MAKENTPEVRKRRIIGIVVSNKAEKTATVAVERRVRHPIYRKAYTVTRKFLVHDEDNACQVDDVVTIEETRPLSARKRWRVVERQAAETATPGTARKAPAAPAKKKGTA